MILFLWNLILALLWAMLSNDLSLLNLSFGFALSYAILFLTTGILGKPKYFLKSRIAATFLALFLYELVTSALRVAHDILTPRHRMHPGVVAVPLDARTDFEITFLANVISLTPGTLSLDVADDRKILYIHSMYIDNQDVESFRRSIKENLEARVLELLR